jgi:uncharacterized protein YprB with RNaseH-like and TPR domain
VQSLAHQLAFLKSRQSAPALAEPAIEGLEEVTALGRHLVVRKVLADDHYHGRVRLSRFSSEELGRLCALLKRKGAVPDRERIVFLDTETTGLQGGTGMVPFLTGVGYFERDEFHVAQYFIRNFDEEPSALVALEDLLRRFSLVVTYNGASFDIPLLETRFTLARLNSPFQGMEHLDLLPAARRLWREGHGSCRLSALENKIARFLRGADVPGAAIPRAYFDYVRGRGGAVMQGVLKHNVDDIVSLAALAVCAADRVNAQPAAFDNPEDLYSLARIVENTTEWKNAIVFYEMALSGGLSDPLQFKARENLITLHRRAGDHVKAMRLCEELIREEDFSRTAWEGAAIHYERVAGDAVRAFQILEQALTVLDKVAGNKRDRAALERRRERLLQKGIRFQDAS